MWQIESVKKIGHKKIYGQLTEFPRNTNKQIGSKTINKSKGITSTPFG